MLVLVGFLSCRQWKLSLTDTNSRQFLIILSQTKEQGTGKEQEVGSWAAWSSQDGTPGIVYRRPPIPWKSSLGCGLCTPPLPRMIFQEPSFLCHSLKFQSPWQEYLQMPQLSGEKII